jgi:hypothetical protein
MFHRVAAVLMWGARETSLLLLNDQARRVTVHLDNSRARYTPSGPDVVDLYSDPNLIGPADGR